MKLKFTSILFLLFISLSAQTETNELTVQKAISLALNSNTTINQVNERINQKDGQWWSSFGLSSPTVSYFKEGIDKNSSPNFAEQRWSVEQSIDFPLKTVFRLNRVSNEKAALLNKLEAEKLNVIANVKSRYTDILYAKDLMKLAGDQIRITTQLKNAVTTRVQVGEASELELMRADIRLSEAKNDLNDAERMFQKSRYELFNVIGLDPEDQKYEIRFVDSLKYFNVSIDQEDAVTRLEQQPEYRSITNSLDASGNKISGAWSSFLPDLSFSYYKQDYGTGYDYYGYQVGLKVPLWFVFNQNGDIQMAKAGKRELEWKQKEIYLNMKKQIEKAWHSYQSSKLTIKRFTDVIQVKANDLLDKTLEGYQVGEIDFLSLIDAQQTFLSSRKRYLSSLHDYYLQLINLEKYMNNEIVFN